MTRRLHWLPAALAAALVLPVSGCADALDALTSHARPVAEVAGEDLSVEEVATLMADSPVPDSALTANWAAQIGRLWTDYVSIVRLYQAPDTTLALDYDALLADAGYYAALSVAHYRDSVVLAGLEPTDEELRAWFVETEPLTRLDVRRIRLGVPEGASGAQRDSLFSEARRLRERVAAGADFIEVARAASDEPAAARGQVLAYQGHPDFPPAADSVVFDLEPGQISPVVATDEEMVFYRVERRRSPEFEAVEDILRRELVEQRRERRLADAADSLLENSRRIVADGAEDIARRVATSSDMAAGRVSGSLRLVRYDGGAYTVSELRQLFRARPDLRQRFEEAEDEELGVFLYQLAGDEVLVQAASRSGVVLPDSARAALRLGLAGQLAKIASRMDVSHALVTNPAFDVTRESRRFVEVVLNRGTPVPLPTEFRPLLDQRFPSRVDERSAEAAARQAREQRGLSLELDEAPTPEEHGEPHDAADDGTTDDAATDDDASQDDGADDDAADDAGTERIS